MGWSKRLGNKPDRKRYDRVSSPAYGEIEAALVFFIRNYTDHDGFADSVHRLRDRYGRYVNWWLEDISRIYGIAQRDLRTAFVVSQRRGWRKELRDLFRRAFPEYAKEYEELPLALETYTRYYLDDKNKNRLEVSAENLREAHGRAVLPWIRAIESVYRSGNYDMRCAFGVSQEGSWRMNVKDLFRRTFPDIAHDYDKWVSEQRSTR